MGHFYFHLITPTGRETDEIGIGCESAETAYLEARRAAVEIASDAAKQSQSVAHYRFEVCDEAFQPVMDVPFAEILGQRIPPPPEVSAERIYEGLAARIERSRTLQAEFKAVVAETRETLAVTRALLKRV